MQKAIIAFAQASSGHHVTPELLAQLKDIRDRVNDGPEWGDNVSQKIVYDLDQITDRMEEALAKPAAHLPIKEVFATRQDFVASLNISFSKIPHTIKFDNQGPGLVYEVRRPFLGGNKSDSNNVLASYVVYEHEYYTEPTHL